MPSKYKTSCRFGVEIVDYQQALAVHNKQQMLDANKKNKLTMLVDIFLQ